MTTNPPSIAGFVIDDDSPPPSKPARVSKSDDTITLRGVRVPLASDVGGAFVTDCARNRERLFSDDQLQEKYDIAPTDWSNIVKNKTLRLAISRECERRMLNNDAAREAAAKEFTRCPEVLGKILHSENISPRARIQAAQELRATARAGDERSDDNRERVIVTINLGGDERLVVDSGPLPPKRAKEALNVE